MAFVQRPTFTAKAMRARDPLVVPNVAPVTGNMDL